MSTPILMTQAGYDRLQLELEALRDESRHEILERIRHARAEGGDLADNGELMDALEEQGLLDRRIAELEALLADAQIATAPIDGTAGLGTTVSLRTTSGAVARYQLVGDGEADGSASQISIHSPVGQALLGRRPGDRIEVRAPRRTRRLELLSVEPLTPLQAAA